MMKRLLHAACAGLFIVSSAGVSATSDDGIETLNGFDGVWASTDHQNEGLIVRELVEGIFFYWATFDQDGSPLWLYGFAEGTASSEPSTLTWHRFDQQGSDHAPEMSLWGSAAITPQQCDSLQMVYHTADGTDSGVLRFNRLGNELNSICQTDVNGKIAGLRLFDCPPGTPNEGVDWDSVCEEKNIGPALREPGSSVSIHAINPAIGDPVNLLSGKLVVEKQSRFVSRISALAQCSPNVDPELFDELVEVTGISEGQSLEVGRAYDISVRLGVPETVFEAAQTQCYPSFNIQVDDLGTIMESEPGVIVTFRH